MATASITKETPAPKGVKAQWLDRDQSLLAFNARVLDWAKRPEVPLLERLRYLCIVSSNLDEFLKCVLRSMPASTARLHRWMPQACRLKTR